tara:strand:- start:2434 stop:2763 length:330 start_codon:yes stop_codon:yes gene_type:complete
MYDTIYREQFVARMETYQAASGWSRAHLFLLFDHLEDRENATFQIKFDVSLLADWEAYASPDEWLEMNSEQADPTNFGDYDNPTWDDIKNCVSTVLHIFSTSEGVVSLH